MPTFDSNDPSSFGWSLGSSGIVPLVYAGHTWPGGVQALLVPVFTHLLNRLCSTAGFQLHPGESEVSGMWGYEDRNVTNGSVKSFHAYGAALDINAPWNGYGATVPPASPWRLPMNSSDICEPLGLLWGGGPRWGSHRDWMHFECHLSPSEARAAHPITTPAAPVVPAAVSFPLPAGYYYGPYTGPAQSISGSGLHDGQYRPGLVLAQQHLHVAADGLYGPATAAAIRSFQASHGLATDGLLGPLTWQALISRPLF